jgi:hypothetical protein
MQTGAEDAGKNHSLSIYFNVLTYYREEEHYEIEPNSEFRQFAACMVLAIGLSGRALASCEDSLSAMAAGAAASNRWILKI